MTIRACRRLACNVLWNRLQPGRSSDIHCTFSVANTDFLAEPGSTDLEEASGQGKPLE